MKELFFLNFIKKIKLLDLIFLGFENEDKIVFLYKGSSKIYYHSSSYGYLIKTTKGFISIEKNSNISKDILNKILVFFLVLENKYSFLEILDFFKDINFLILKEYLGKNNFEILSKRITNSINFIGQEGYILECNNSQNNKILIVGPYPFDYTKGLLNKITKLSKIFQKKLDIVISFSKHKNKKYFQLKLADNQEGYFILYSYIPHQIQNFNTKQNLKLILESLLKLHSVSLKKDNKYTFGYIQTDPNNGNFLYNRNEMIIIDYETIEFQKIVFQPAMLFVKYIDLMLKSKTEKLLYDIFYDIYDFYIKYFGDEINLNPLYNYKYFENYNNYAQIKDYLDKNKDFFIQKITKIQNDNYRNK